MSAKRTSNVWLHQNVYTAGKLWLASLPGGGQSAIQLALAIWQQGLPFTGTSANDMWPSGGSYMAATNAENRTMAPTKRDRRSRQQGGGGTLSLNPNLLL